MNVLLISQCNKRALTETRRILDQFAERRGDCAWQTPITQAGLDTLRKMLKKTARRNTSVACHWIRGRDHSELLWIVGDARRFNAQGAVPTNSTESDVLRRDDENDWHTAEDIRLLAELGALFHDFGKSSRAFQEKLRANSRRPVADAFRHEWVSLRLFGAFVGPDSDQVWLERLTHCDERDTEVCLTRLVRDDSNMADSPFRSHRLHPLATVVSWLMLSHHRLPYSSAGFNARGLQYLLTPVVATWNDARPDASRNEKASCWEFPNGLPFASPEWCRRAQKCARAMIERPRFVQNAERFLDDPFVAHLSRLSLMLADHYYSSLPGRPHSGDNGPTLFANTDRLTGGLNQRLDEHIAGVTSNARRVARTLPRLEKELPRIARCRSFQRRSEDDRFRWQDKAYDLATALRQVTAESGFFGINMASTGCGKTLANGRILYGLADPQRGTRFTIALGLRTLTLQTGMVYRDRLGLGDDDLAVLVGGGAVRELFELGQREQNHSLTGDESAQELLSEDSYVHFEGNVEEGPLKRWLSANPDANKLLQAPVVVCTIDHLVPATESLRGGRQIGPTLRLLTSDLVLDEPDDFDMDDLPALSRLVHWAGVFGSRLLLSSATLAPALVEGLFEAYRTGRAVHQQNRGPQGRQTAITCAWFDEFRAETNSVASSQEFKPFHDSFVAKRLKRLREQEARRAVKLVSVASSKKDRQAVCEELAVRLPDWVSGLHGEHHTVDPKSKKLVSFGLIRMANIEPLTLVATSLYEQGAPPNTRIHLCVYHSQHPLLMRSAIERQLDQSLRRNNPLAVFELPDIRGAIDGCAELNQVFVVLASPVAEVGRDHDYDWAIVEPSSMRSIIQLAGRVRRHRPGPCKAPNILVLGRNIKALMGEQVAFNRPGFEDKEFLLSTHSLDELLTSEQLAVIDAGPRIQEREQLEPGTNLVDLEHQRLRVLMLGEGVPTTRFTAPHWWTTRAHLIGQLQHGPPRFRAGPVEETFALVPKEDDESRMDFFRCDTWTPLGNLYREMTLAQGPRIQTWGPSDYLDELSKLAEQLDMDLARCAKRFGTIHLRPEQQGWTYNPMIGFRRQV